MKLFFKKTPLQQGNIQLFKSSLIVLTFKETMQGGGGDNFFRVEWNEPNFVLTSYVLYLVCHYLMYGINKI